MAKSFADWLKRQPAGTRAAIIRDGRISERAVRRAQLGERLGYDLAEHLSRLTGGKVSIKTLCKGVKEDGNGSR